MTNFREIIIIIINNNNSNNNNNNNFSSYHKLNIETDYHYCVIEYKMRIFSKTIQKLSLFSNIPNHNPILGLKYPF